MLRELADQAFLEDFVHGLARASGLRIYVHDSRGGLITAAGEPGEFVQQTGCPLDLLPAGLRLTPVPAHDPPGAVAFFARRGVSCVAAPVYLDEQQAGWLTTGDFREGSPAGETWQDLAGGSPARLNELIQLWERLPRLDRRGSARPVVTARWGARLLAGWCRRESRLSAVTAEAALVGDIAELLTGDQALAATLDRIVARTAAVMHCRYCSLRLYDPRTNELTIMAVHNLSRRYVGKGRVSRAASTIDDEALSGKVVYVENAASDPRIQYPDEMVREGIVSLLTAGMFYRKEPVGVIRVYTDRRQRFRQAQRNLLRVVAHQAAIAIVHARLVEQRLRSAETERQLALAGAIQTRMMLVPAPQRPNVQTACIYQPTSHLGGDFCDIFELCDGRLAAVVADVVGKGIPASILSATVRGALRATAQCCSDLGELLTRLNRQVCCQTRSSEFVTLLLVAVDRAARRLGYARAGHEPLLLLRGGELQCAADGEGVLGLAAEERFREHTLALQDGDLLLLYTDGAIDAMNFAGGLFGRERLAAALRQYGGPRVDQVLQNVLWDIRRFVGLAEQSDDLTLVGLRIGAGDEPGT